MNRMKKSCVAILIICMLYVPFTFQSIKVSAVKVPSVNYQSNIQNTGWQNFVKDGETSGTINRDSNIEAFRMNLSNTSVSGGINYSVYTKTKGWETEKTDNQIAGETGKEFYIEAVRISLTGEMKNQYDIYYRVNIENQGWLDWTKNGQNSGSIGQNIFIKALEVVVVKKGESQPQTEKSEGSNPSPKAESPKVETPKEEAPKAEAPKAEGPKEEAPKAEAPAAPQNVLPSVNYQTHVENIGWQNYVKDGEEAGTSGRALRVESIKIKLSNTTISGSVSYATHVENIGWQNYMKDDEIAGTTGKSLRIEAVKVLLTGEISKQYDIYYRSHIQYYGWLGWTKNGQSSGSEGRNLRIEALEIKLVKKGEATIQESEAFKSKPLPPSVNYQAHVENVGWQNFVKDGAVAGTSGRGLRVESFKMNLSDTPVSGGVAYAAHVENIGWQEEKSSNQIAGTTGKGLRIEALKILLTGEISNQYDIYYRVHIQDYGWLGWTKNGQNAGSQGRALRMEAVEAKLVKKGESAPATGNAFIQPEQTYFYINAPNYNQYALGAPSGCEGMALFQAEQAKGRLRDWTPRAFLNTMPHATTPYEGFVGSPFEEKFWVYSAMYPKPLTEWASRYGGAKNVSGASMSDLIGEIKRGNPSVIWLTVKLQPVRWGTWWFGQAVNNNHAVTLDGWNAKTNQVHLSDSISGSYWVDKNVVESIYNARRYAVVIY